MVKPDFKEIINPFILLPLICILMFLLGFRNLNLIYYTFIIFFIFSFINTSVLHLRKAVKKYFYLYIYVELFFSLIFIIPLFYMIGLKQPILTGFFIISLVDFIIQAYYNLLPRKDGKQVIKLWKNRLISSEREHFHPISLQRYTFKDFTCKILEPGKINPTRNHVMNHRLMELRLLNHILKHQFGNKDSLVFSLDKITLENNARTVKGLNIDKKILSKLKRINKNITNNIITCYMFRKSFLRIVFNKNFALENSQQTYNFLKKVRSKTK